MAGLRHIAPGAGKIKAATLTEVLVALVIMVIIFGLAMQIYTRVVFSVYATSRIRARQEMKRMIGASIATAATGEEETAIDSIIYHKTVAPYRSYEHLGVVKITATQNGVSLGELRQVFKIKTHEN